jgi:hypothetical protein
LCGGEGDSDSIPSGLVFSLLMSGTGGLAVGHASPLCRLSLIMQARPLLRAGWR